ncbi:TPA: MFS transporter [Klebsiella aerogenes]|uniref:MFS transporter n=1 Tax=Klebsiella aerogenes TaxID=548 RepID=A0AAP9QTT3_KLEAE|nr:MFS transporter [Klebsiella aerogenes]EKU4511242.1 MFS transporter [Klebsiella aerogenes]EKU6671779.1 MFS transporter [Klebsiella aerogenes]EKU7552134.1 MFS transporter [Klebsiella aerogenes]EKV3450671.1 MFS transporter [Klebsiella aerogenes]EKX4409676.1 MFS transporter [Klebsiella aerogenes]
MNSSAVSPGRAGLLLLLTGQMLPLIDTSITNVALDSITHSLDASATQLELIVALYGVAFAVCLAMGSKLGDNYGRRRLFLWGVAIFGIASLLCGMANSINTLLAARTLQGAGAALIVPQILATLHVTLKGTAHARAISLYGGIGGIAFIVGQMGGGWLVSADIAGLGWRNAFFINVPICLLVLAFSHRYVPETRRESHSSIDWQGTFSLALILCCLLFPMALGPELHWPWELQLLLLAVLPLLAWMRLSALRKQQRGEQPLLPPRLLKLTSIRFGMAIALLFFSAWSGFMFCMALTMQAGLGMAPWQSGNSFIALGVAYFISALYAPKLIARYSMGRILLIGLAVQISGLLLLSATVYQLGLRTTTLALVPSTALIGYGQALIVNSFYRIGMRDIRACDAGAGSAILSTLQQATLGLGPAILGSLFLTLAQRGGGDYTQALIVFLLVEVAMMLLLGAIALWLRRHLNLQPVATAS